MSVPKNTAILTRIPNEELFITRRLEVSDVLTLLTPKILVPAEAGYVFIPTRCHFRKPAGIAYTVAGMTGINVRSNGNLLLAGNNFQVGLLDQTADTHLVMLGPGNAAGLFSGTNLTTTGSGAIDIIAIGANPAVGNSPLDLALFYWKYPIGFGLL